MDYDEIINTREQKTIYTPIDFDKDIKSGNKELDKRNLELFNKIKFDSSKMQCLMLNSKGYILCTVKNNEIVPFEIV